MHISDCREDSFSSQVCQCSVPAAYILRRQRQEEHTFEDSMGYVIHLNQTRQEKHTVILFRERVKDCVGWHQGCTFRLCAANLDFPPSFKESISKPSA